MSTNTQPANVQASPLPTPWKPWDVQPNIVVQMLDALSVVPELGEAVLALLPEEMADTTWDLGEYRELIRNASRVSLSADEIELGSNLYQLIRARNLAWIVLTTWPGFGPIVGRLTDRQLDLARYIWGVANVDRHNIRQSTYQFRADLHSPVTLHSDVSRQVEIVDDLLVLDPGQRVSIFMKEVVFIPLCLSTDIVNKTSLVVQHIALLGATAIDSGFGGFLLADLENRSRRPYVIHDGSILCKAQFTGMTEYVNRPYPNPNFMRTLPVTHE